MKRVWNEHLDNILRRNYPKGDLDALAQRMGMTIGAIKCRACVLGLKRKVHKREPWTDRQLAYLRKHYADMRAEDIDPLIRRLFGERVVGNVLIAPQVLSPLWQGGGYKAGVEIKQAA